MTVELLLLMDNGDGSTSFNDSSGNAVSMTPGNIVQSNSITIFGPSCGYGDGTISNYLIGIINNPPGAGDFTIEGRVYSTNDAEGLLFLLGDSISYAVRLEAGGVISVYSTVAGSNIIQSAGSTWSLSTQHHIMFERVSGTMYLGIDGTIVGSASNGGTIDNVISCFGDGGSLGFSALNGYMDEIRYITGENAYGGSNYTVPDSFAFNLELLEVANLADGAELSAIYAALALVEQIGLANIATISFQEGLVDAFGLSDAVLRSYASDINETISLTDIVSRAVIIIELIDAFNLNDILDNPAVVFRLVAAIGLVDGLESRVVSEQSLAEQLSLSEQLGINLLLSLNDAITLSDDLIEIFTYLINITEVLGLAHVQEIRGDYQNSILSGILLSDILRESRVLGLNEILELADSLSDWISGALNLVDDAAFSDSLANTLSLFVSVSEDIALTASLTNQAAINLILSETAILGGNITIEGDEYVAWVMNPQGELFTKYTNYPFNSFVAVGQEAYGVADDGIYVLKGDDDDGTAIEARMKGGLMDFGTSAQKNLRHGYMGLSTDGDVLMRVSDTGRGRRKESWYRLKGRTGSNLFEARKSFSNNIQARYWQFEVRNFDGNRFELDEIEWHTVILRRRTKGAGNG